MTKYTVEAGSGWRATLDGKQVLYAQEADAEAGYVLAPLIDAQGKPIFDHSSRDYAIVRREGKVQVTKSGMTPEQRVLIAEDDNPFRVETARDGELSANYADKRQPVFTE
jgi:hypothetical protein